MQNEDETKWLPAERLRELLAMIPPDSRVVVGYFGGLSVLTADGESALGFVDFSLLGGVTRWDMP